MLRLARPSDKRLARLTGRFHDVRFNYEEVGATRDELPAGYNRVYERTPIGSGEVVYDAAAYALRGWRMHREAGLAVASESNVARPGAVVLLGAHLGPLWLILACGPATMVDARVSLTAR